MTKFSFKLILPLLCLGTISFLASCDKDYGEWSDKVEVFFNQEDSVYLSQSVIFFDIAGSDQRLYIKSSLDVEIAYQQDPMTDNWITLSDVGYDEKMKSNYVDVHVEPMTKTLAMRTGMLNITSPKDFFGSFITLAQGLYSRYLCNFSLLQYGNVNPAIEGGERLLSEWAENQVEEYTLASTTIQGQAAAYCYGRNGYMALGNSEGYGADVTIPYVTDIRLDSVVVFALNALAFTDIEGHTDRGRAVYVAHSESRQIEEYRRFHACRGLCFRTLDGQIDRHCQMG